MKTNSKVIGGTFERKVAKELSIWMFNDEHVLKREPTSGATKSIYCGDIFPMKQINWERWPFLIECKYGYSDLTPTLLNFKITEDWYIKAFDELKKSQYQDIILLIQNFKNRRGILLSTNIELNCVWCKCILCIKIKNCVEYVFCYDYKELFEYEFEDVFSNMMQ